MKQKHADYQRVSYPKNRRFMDAACHSVQGKSMMYGLLEVDGVTAARFTQRLKELIESGYDLFDSTVESEQTPLSREVNYVYNSRESNLS